jgi:hypothetical protein
MVGNHGLFALTFGRGFTFIFDRIAGRFTRVRAAAFFVVVRVRSTPIIALIPCGADRVIVRKLPFVKLKGGDCLNR